MDLTMDFATIIELGKKVGEAEAKAEAKRAKATTTKKKKSGGGRGKGRNRGQETPLTAKLIYKVMDITDATIYYVHGLGKTEQLVDQLLAEEHTLYKFTANNSGSRIKNGSYYLCVLSADGKKGYRAFFRPTDRFSKAKVIRDDEVSSLGLVEMRNWPEVAGGFYFQLVHAQAAISESNRADARSNPFYGPHRAIELAHLQSLDDQEDGPYVINSITDERALLDAVELVCNTHVGEEATRKAGEILRRGTTRYGLTPEEASSIDTASADRGHIAELEAKVEALETSVAIKQAALDSSITKMNLAKRLAIEIHER